MAMKTFLLNFHLNNDKAPESTFNTINDIIKKELPDLDQYQKIPIKNLDFIILYTSSKEDYSLTIRYYSNNQLVSINGEMLNTCKWFKTDFIAEKLKNKINPILSVEGKNSKDLIEIIPAIKRDNAVPVYFYTSDGRMLEYDFDQILVNETTSFQNIKILHSPTLGNSLLLDDMQNLAESDLPYTHGLMNYPQNNFKDKEILILGGGDGGLLHELLKESPKFVTMIDIDEKVMIHCQKYLRGACGDVLDTFQGENYHIIVADCIKYMQDYVEQGKTFDVIFNDLTDIPISTPEQRGIFIEDNQKLWLFVKEILELSMKILRPAGMYFNHAIGVNCKKSLEDYENLLRNLPNVKLEFSRHTRYIPSFMEDWVFYQLKKI